MRNRKRRAHSSATSAADATVEDNGSTSLYSLTDAAHQLGVHPRTLSRWLSAAHITPHRGAGDGRQRLLTNTELETLRKRFSRRHARADTQELAKGSRLAKSNEWREEAERLKRARQASRQIETLTRQADELQEAIKKLKALLEKPDKVG